MPCFPKERAYVGQDWVVRGIYRRDADIPYDANFFRAAFRLGTTARCIGLDGPTGELVAEK